MNIIFDSLTQSLKCHESDLATGWYKGRIRGFGRDVLFHKSPKYAFVMDPATEAPSIILLIQDRQSGDNVDCVRVPYEAVEIHVKG